MLNNSCCIAQQQPQIHSLSERKPTSPQFFFFFFPNKMIQRRCIFLISLLSSFSPLGSTTAMLNLTLPGQHPNPEAVVQDVQRRVNVSLSRRQMLSYTAEEHWSSTTCLTGNPIDDCWRCDPNWQLNRQRLADCGIGFGQQAVGGKGGRYYVVTDSSDHDPVNPQPGTLRHAVIQDEPLWIVFAANMLIHLSQELIFNSHKTVDGRGANVHVTGGGCITLQYVSNVIIHSIHIHHCYQSGEANVRSSPTHFGWRTLSDGDGISIFGSKDIWVDHCSLSHCKDGLIDAVMGSTGITISNSWFSHHNEVMLLGHSDDYLPDSGMQVTIAFNHFGKKLIQRMPRCRRGYIHVVNNDFTRWEMYAIGGSGNPTINSQGNRYIAPFNSDAKEVTKRVDTDTGDWRDWNWRSEGDVMVNGAYFVESGEAVEVKYEKAFSVEPRSASFLDQITQNAGVLGGRSNKLSKLTAGNNGGGGTILESESDEDDSGDMFGSDAPPLPILSNSILFSLLIALSSSLFLCFTPNSAL